MPPKEDETRCATTCYYHDERTNDIKDLQKILNGELGEVGLVGKVNTIIETQKSIITRLDNQDSKFWKLTVMMLGGLAMAAFNLFLLLVKGSG